MIRFKPRMEDLRRLRSSLAGLPAAVQPIALVGAARSADRLARMVREAILTQSLRMKALSKGWKEEKKRRGFDPRKLIATREYVDSIGVYPTAQGYAIGTDWEFVLIHEYGAPAANIPARPHWRPTVNKWQRAIGKDITPYMQSAIDAFFRQGKSGVAQLEQRAGNAAKKPKGTKGSTKVKTKSAVLGVTKRGVRTRTAQVMMPAGSKARKGKETALSQDVQKLIKEALGARRRSRST